MILDQKMMVNLRLNSLNKCSTQVTQSETQDCKRETLLSRRLRATRECIQSKCLQQETTKPPKQDKTNTHKKKWTS